ncbi:MAG: glycosyltransferase [Acidimicrobiaceae bacterium]|nr:glycosyltransferase [Acidimicrobiaceae bacterium]
MCRARHVRPEPVFDPTYQPRVSLHIPAYNEPPDMLIETIRSAEGLDYPNFEVVVIDNNTSDPDVWRPVEEYCANRPNLKFIHVEHLDGFKSGALNLALGELTDPAAEIVGVIDADYVIRADYLRRTVGYFADPGLAFVQTPQDYRDHDGDYFTACYDAYRYFFATAMPSRNERNSIIFAGTMGLLRRPLLEAIGGWDEWCITEDAETSLRLLAAGYSSQFVAESFGSGIMPLTFSSLKKQRFRWCFGGMQILRRHWRSLVPWSRSPTNRLTTGQRLDYLFGGLQWMNDLVLLGFAVVLLIVGGLLLSGSSVAIRPLVGPTILLPGTLLATGLLRALWALRYQTRITVRRAVLAFANWLSLSLTVSRACLQGLIRSQGTFMRTAKTGESHGVASAVRAALPETVLAALLWGTAIACAITIHATALLLALMFWQGAVYLTSPYMSWLSGRARLTPMLERRRRTEDLRDRLAAAARPAAAGTAALAAGAGAFVLILAVGAIHAGHPRNPFAVPTRSTTPPSSPSHPPTGPPTTSGGKGASRATPGSTETTPTSTSSTTGSSTTSTPRTSVRPGTGSRSRSTTSTTAPPTSSTRPTS